MTQLTSCAAGASHDPDRCVGPGALSENALIGNPRSVGVSRVCYLRSDASRDPARRSDAQDATSLCEAMDAFIQLPIHQATWDHLGHHLASLRAKGLPTPFQDVLLAAVAIDHNAELWFYDAHFRTIQGVLTNLILFEGPAA